MQVLERRKLLFNKKSSGNVESTDVPCTTGEWGDAVFWTGAEFRAYHYTDFADLPKSYKPIGIVTVPASLDLYGNGNCGIMSLKYMSVGDPDNGIIDNSIANVTHTNLGYTIDDNVPFGPLTVKSSLAADFISQYSIPAREAVVLGSTTITAWNQLTLPFNTANEISNKRNFGTKIKDIIFNGTSSFSSTDIQTFYDAVGARFSALREANSIPAAANKLGRDDHDKLIEYVTLTKGSAWKTASDLFDYNDNEYSPINLCCWRYHTPGTNQGDWYLWQTVEALYTGVMVQLIDVVMCKLVYHFNIPYLQLPFESSGGEPMTVYNGTSRSTGGRATMWTGSSVTGTTSAANSAQRIMYTSTTVGSASNRGTAILAGWGSSVPGNYLTMPYITTSGLFGVTESYERLKSCYTPAYINLKMVVD